MSEPVPYPFGGMGGGPDTCLLCSGPPCVPRIHEKYAAQERAYDAQQQAYRREMAEHMKVCTGIGVKNHRHGDDCEPGSKAQVIDRLLWVWKEHPDMRLGQLIENVFHHSAPDHCFYAVEDADLISQIEAFYQDH